MKAKNLYQIVLLCLFSILVFSINDSKANDCNNNQDCWHDEITEQCAWWADQGIDCIVFWPHKKSDDVLV
jgi:hypothetical protein